MQPVELFWVKIAALGQVAGAVATFLAVAVSLYVAFAGRRPKVRLTVGERQVIGINPDNDIMVLMFSVVNAGERPVHVRGIGWRTGWFRYGPKFLRRQVAVQMTGGFQFGKDPPYELQPGAETSSYALMDNVLNSIRDKKKGRTFFTRVWPLKGQRQTRIRGYVYTADGHTFYANAEDSLARQLAQAEFDQEEDVEQGP